MAQWGQGLDRAIPMTIQTIASIGLVTTIPIGLTSNPSTADCRGPGITRRTRCFAQPIPLHGRFAIIPLPYPCGTGRSSMPAHRSESGQGRKAPDCLRNASTVS